MKTKKETIIKKNHKPVSLIIIDIRLLNKMLENQMQRYIEMTIHRITNLGLFVSF